MAERYRGRSWKASINYLTLPNFILHSLSPASQSFLFIILCWKKVRSLQQNKMKFTGLVLFMRLEKLRRSALLNGLENVWQRDEAWPCRNRWVYILAMINFYKSGQEALILDSFFLDFHAQVPLAHSTRYRSNHWPSSLADKPLQ